MYPYMSSTHLSWSWYQAARLYNDCLVALDFDGKEHETAEVVAKLQLPVCTNLAACLIESGPQATLLTWPIFALQL
ncbi:unnamed protein product [Symbiodinium pilosum]|uniref:Uncharacterized protein n=1 Tax=Symbiodinium pilosum TaxID=2952 RepID=A0A812NPJ9_SYMPI|nr:unnamed protein product [Symbiodinium pilosum]